MTGSSSGAAAGPGWWSPWSTVGTSDTQTQMAWRVPDVRAAVDDLRARGVRIEEYEGAGPGHDRRRRRHGSLPGFAGFIDPSGNVLAMVQPKP